MARVTWARPVAQRYRYTSSRSTVYLYIAVKDQRTWLRMKTQYAASDWLFVEKVVAFADGQTSTLTTDDFERDNDTRIWEWADETPTPSQLSVLSTLANAKDATLRFSGSTYYDDVRLSAADKKALRDVVRDFAELEKLLGD
jgi:hypothetical protein